MMAVLGFLRVNWKPFAIIVIVALAWWLLHRYGDERYSAGETARDRYWQPLFAAAEKAAAEANAHTAAIETAQQAASAEAEAHNAEVITSVNARAADAERRLRALSVRVQARRSCSGEVSASSGAASVPDDSTASAERAQRSADALVGLARRCELDATIVRGWQDWYRTQAALTH